MIKIQYIDPARLIEPLATLTPSGVTPAFSVDIAPISKALPKKLDC